MLVIGLHPIKAREPVHLLEVDLSGFEGEIDWRGFTQPLAGNDSSYWQVPYNERPVPGSDGHWCFFFRSGPRPTSSDPGGSPDFASRNACATSPSIY